jgi:hypothetical protein
MRGLQPPLGRFTLPQEIKNVVFPNTENAKQRRKIYSWFLPQYISLSLDKLHNDQMPWYSQARPAIPGHSGAIGIRVYGLMLDYGPNTAGGHARFFFSLFEKVWGPVAITCSPGPASTRRKMDGVRSNHLWILYHAH